MLERIRDNDKVDELIMLIIDGMEDDELPAFAQAEADLEEARASADPADALFQLRAEYLLHVVRISRCIARAFYINGREKCWDLHKGDWNDFREELRALFSEIRAEAETGAPVYSRLMRLEKWPKRFYDAPNPLKETDRCAAEIDVKKVLSSREL